MKYFWRTLTAAAVSVAVRTVMKKIQDRSEKNETDINDPSNPSAAHIQ